MNKVINLIIIATAIAIICMDPIFAGDRHKEQVVVIEDNGKSRNSLETLGWIGAIGCVAISIYKGDWCWAENKVIEFKGKQEVPQ